MNMNDVEVKSDIITVTVPKTKTNVPRLFAITETPWIQLVEKYVQLRPTHSSNNRFFLTYRRGRCTTSPIGINKMGAAPKEIAKFLKLPHPELYTGHCFRRSSASHLANQGGDLLTIKKHGGWKSSSVAEGYVDASLRKKIQVANMFSHQAGASTSAASSAAVHLEESLYMHRHYNNPQHPVGTDNANCTATKQNLPQNQNILLSEQSLPGISIVASNTATVNVKIYSHCTVKDD